jgi:hypothetical protein
MIKPNEIPGTVVTVTADDIARGCQTSANNCPIARAVRRALRCSGKWISVNWKLSVGKKARIYLLPKSTQTFIDAFDGGKAVKPFSFKIGKEVK